MGFHLVNGTLLASQKAKVNATEEATGGEAGPVEDIDFENIDLEDIEGQTPSTCHRGCHRDRPHEERHVSPRPSRRFVPEIRSAMHKFVKGLVDDACTYAEHGKRTTVKAMDVIHALRKRGHNLYGYT